MTGTGGTSAPMYGGMGGVDEGGLNTGAANMLADCKATAMGVEGEPSVPVVGPDGWIRFGVGTNPPTHTLFDFAFDALTRAFSLL